MNEKKVILFNCASRGRINQLFSLLDNIKTWVDDKDNYFVCLKVDLDDVKTNRIQHKQILESQPKVIVRWGTSTSKIHAINRSLEDLPHWDIICTASDDQLFTARGFDNIIRNNIEEGKHFYHYPEPFSANRVSVMNITTREYYERRGWVYCPEYYSLFCDEDETECAKMLGVYKLCEEQIFEHYHYSTNIQRLKVPKDPLYIRNDTYRADEKIFKERKARNFDLPINTDTDNTAEKAAV